MPTSNEFNQLRRLVGDYGITKIDNPELDALLDDSTWELTSHNFSTPINDFDAMDISFHNEIIYKAAINYWWLQVAKLQAKLSTTVGASAQNVSELWQRALQMVEELETRYEVIQQLGDTINIGNASYFSKQSLRRIGGGREEDTPTPAPFSGLTPFQGLNP